MTTQQCLDIFNQSGITINPNIDIAIVLENNGLSIDSECNCTELYYILASQDE